MNITLKDKIDNTLVSARCLFAAECAKLDVNVSLSFTRDAPRRVWDRQALLSQSYVEFVTGKRYSAVKKWVQRGHITPAKTIGTAPLFDAGFVEHLLQTETFAMSDDELCEAAWIARAFWAWVPRDGLEAAPGSPAERISKMPFIHDIYALVDERLAEVAALRRAAAEKQVTATRAVKPKKRTA